jgi:signal peptidase I
MPWMTGPIHGSPPPSSDRARAEWLPLYADALRDRLAGGVAVHLPLSGASMRPAIDDGATLVVAGAGAAKIRPGDIVVYEDAGRVICHRVLWQRRTSSGRVLLTKGDGIALPPIWVPAAALIGRVVATETGGMRRQLDGPDERVRALAVLGRAWAVLLARRLLRAMRVTMAARAA